MFDEMAFLDEPFLRGMSVHSFNARPPFTAISLGPHQWKDRMILKRHAIRSDLHWDNAGMGRKAPALEITCIGSWRRELALLAAARDENGACHHLRNRFGGMKCVGIGLGLGRGPGAGAGERTGPDDIAGESG